GVGSAAAGSAGPPPARAVGRRVAVRGAARRHAAGLPRPDRRAARGRAQRAQRARGRPGLAGRHRGRGLVLRRARVGARVHSSSPSAPDAGWRTCSIAEIYKGSKQGHLRTIARKVGCELEDMIFFDNEPYNCDNVCQLGVTCIFCPGGVTDKVWRTALESFPSPGEVIRA
ncbi:unnamed protein product, partial [Prorocentrum cordatum]